MTGLANQPITPRVGVAARPWYPRGVRAARHLVRIAVGAALLGGCSPGATVLAPPTKTPAAPTAAIEDSRPSDNAGLTPTQTEVLEVGATAEPPQIPALDLPARAPTAETGSAFLDRIEGLGRSAMDDAVVAEIERGNVPTHARMLVPLELVADGHTAELWVAADYLAIGSDEDFVRIPMTPAAAQKLAERLDSSLPTPKLVDTIFERAPAKLAPSYIDGGPTDSTADDVRVHNAKVERNRLAKGITLGVLTAGHQKDIVLTTRLSEEEDRVAIYGWHKSDGAPIQSLSCRHSCRYADYSHGVRLVAQAMLVDGHPRRYSDVLRDPELSGLVSAEGPLERVAYRKELPAYSPEVSTKGKPDTGKKKKKKRKKKIADKVAPQKARP